MRSTASTAATRCWASANTALPRIHPTCAWRWLFSMPRFTRYGPMAPRVRFRFGEFHHAPGDTPHVEVALAHGELITHIVIPHLPAARRSHYLKVRDRASYEFALASAAVVLDLDGDTIRAARLGLGGIATKPWRAIEAEQILTGRKASDDTFRDAAEIALAGAVAREHNHFKIELAKRTIVRAFATARDANL